MAPHGMPPLDRRVGALSMTNQPHLLLHNTILPVGTDWGFQGEGVAFVTLKSGGATLGSGNFTRPFAPGDLLLIGGPGIGKLTGSHRGESLLQWFSLAMEHLYPLFDGSEIAVLHGVVDSLKGVNFYPASGHPARETRRLMGLLPETINLEHRSQLLRAASVVLSAEFSGTRRRANQVAPIEERMVVMFDRLSNAELLSMSVADLALKFGCSRRHLDRLFMHYFGISASALKMEMRLLKAVALLRNPDAKVNNVASDCGFNHMGLFNARFKRRFGCSPGQWRGRAIQDHGRRLVPASAPGTCRLRAIGLCPETSGAGVPAVPVLGGEAEA